eukprot:3737576-Amphidinium_carterae.1
MIRKRRFTSTAEAALYALASGSRAPSESPRDAAAAPCAWQQLHLRAAASQRMSPTLVIRRLVLSTAQSCTTIQRTILLSTDRCKT